MKKTGALQGAMSDKGICARSGSLAQLSFKDDKSWAAAFAALILTIYLMNIGQGLQDRLGIPQFFFPLAASPLLLKRLVPCLSSLQRRSILPVLLPLLAIFGLWLGQSLLFPKLGFWFNSVVLSHLLTVYPLYVCVAMIRDSSTIIESLTGVSRLVSVVTLALLIVFRGHFFNAYSMGFSFTLILPTNLLLYRLFKLTTEKRGHTLLLVCSNVIAIALWGSRGSLVSIFAFLISMLICAPVSKKSGYLAKIVILMVLIFSLFNYGEIMSVISRLASTLGLSSRTLDLLANDLFYDSGRSEIWNIIWNNFVNEPIAVRGICSTYPLVGGYSHSFILDILHDFGSVLGLPLLLCIAVCMKKTFHIKMLSDYCNVPKTLFFFSTFPLLFWSASIWTMPYFWCWIASMFKGSIYKKPSSTH